MSDQLDMFRGQRDLFIGLDSAMPKHGDERHRHTESEWTMAIYAGPGGEEIELPAHGMEQAVVERYCSHCQAWIRCAGVVGQLRWMAKHKDGDCV